MATEENVITSESPDRNWSYLGLKKIVLIFIMQQTSV